MDSLGVLRAEPSLALFPAIAKTALYVYATEGRQPDGFENVDFAAAHR